MWVSLYDLMIDSIYLLMFCWTCMFKVKCIIWFSIVNSTSPIDAMSKDFLFVKFNDRFLLYNCNNPWTINFKVKFLLIPTPFTKNRCIVILGYIYLFLYMTSSNINLFSSVSCLKKSDICGFIQIIIEFDEVVKPSFSKLSFCFNVIHDWMLKSFFKSYFSIFYEFVMEIKGHFLSQCHHQYHHSKCEDLDFKLITSSFSFVSMCCIL